MTRSFEHASANADRASDWWNSVSATVSRAAACGRAICRFAPLWLLAAASFGTAQVASAGRPTAGMVITSRALGTYIPNGGYSQQETVRSNEVASNVRVVEALDLTRDQSLTRPPGAAARFSHTLKNTGNVASTYTFTVSNDGAGCTPDELDLGNLQLARDVNSNGAIDSGDVLLPLSTAGALPLQPNETVSLLVQGNLPAGRSSGKACVSVSARADATGVSATNIDRVTVTLNAALIVTKSARHPDVVQPGVTTIDFTIVASNIGAADALPASAEPLGTPVMVDGQARSLLLLRDIIPADSDYVAGSLKTQMPDALRLFRRAGDPHLTYRSTEQNRPAEVAIGLPANLPSSYSASMSFSVRVRSNATDAVRNTAQANYNTGTNVEESSNTVVIPVTAARIGIAKAASAPIAQVDAQGRLDDTLNVRFTLGVRNYGGDLIYNPQVTDLLEGGGTAFGSYTAQEVPSAGQYTIVPGSARIVQLQGGGARAAIREGFTGQADHSRLLADGALLPAGGEITVEFVVRFHGANRPPVLYNRAQAQGALYPNGPMALTDESMDGLDPDPDSDGNPTNNSSPTPVATTPPRLTLTKTVAPPRRTASGVYELDYTLTVANIGGMPAPNLRLVDNLDCTFRMDQADTPVAAWELLGAPQFSGAALKSSARFTGKAPCDRAALTNNDPYASLPTAVALSLTDGSGALAPNQTEVVRFTVRVTLKPETVGRRVQLENRAWAASFSKNAINTVEAATLAVASASTQALLSDPQGVVYNAVTREPVPGATVSMRRESCRSGAVTPIVPEEIFHGENSDLYAFHPDGTVSMVTPANGEYQFFFKLPPVENLCTYGMTVEPPAGSNLVAPSALIPAQPGAFESCGAVVPHAVQPTGADPTTWHVSLLSGRAGAAGEPCEVVHNHIPLDPKSTSGLVLKKESSKSQAELGDFIDYTLTASNRTGMRLPEVRITDRLPPGFTYVPGSTRINGQPAADPQGGLGPELFFVSVQPLNAEEEFSVRYRLRIGVGAPTNGEAINRAQATSGKGTTQLVSNEAASRVHIGGGVFSDEAFIFGKVFLDCDRDGVQGYEEVGIPGVRIFIEDGTGVVTDVEGKWSLYGLRPITHIAKLDLSTLPPGARLALLDHRQSGLPDSRFVDLQKGELQKVNFAIDNCGNPEVTTEVYERRKFLASRPDAEGEAGRVRQRLDPEGKRSEVQDTRALPVSGKVLPDGTMQQPPSREGALIELPNATLHSTTESAEPFVPVAPPEPEPAPEARPPTGSGGKPLEELMPELDNTLDFIGLKNGDVAATRQLTVRVKGSLDTNLRLRLNGEAIDGNLVGTKARLASRKLFALEYVALPLRAGENTFDLEALDEFGGLVEARSIKIVAPDKLASLKVDIPATARADGRTPVPVQVRLLDANGVPVTIAEVVTLETSSGRWEQKDLDPEAKGTQQLIEGGAAQFTLIPPAEPGDGRVRVTANGLVQDAKVALLPDLRPLSGAGVLEGVINLDGRGPIALGAPRARDAFERELRSWSRESGDVSGAARAAFYFKGAVKGEYLLTAAFDSEREERERLFRDIRPDEFYPVYGDSAAKSFDAQSSERLYVRIDKNRSWLLHGDFTTSSSTEVRKLSQISRALTGLQHRYESGRLRVDTYASLDTFKQRIEEFPANGTSGPFYLTSGVDLFVNSERIEIVVRDRDQPELVQHTTPLARFSDYTIDPLSRRLLLTSPVPSLDPELNPQSIRVTYEVDSDAPAFWVGGIDTQTKIGEHLQLGAAAAIDQDPDNERSLGAVTALARLGERTTLAAEMVATHSELEDDGEGARLELRHEGGALRANVQVAKTSAEFDNPNGGIGAGRTEANASAEYKLSKNGRLLGELLLSNDDVGDSERRGAALSLQHTITSYLTGEVGTRVGERTGVQGGFDYGTVSSAASGSSSTSPTASSDGENYVTMRGRLTARLPDSRAQMFVEAEQAVEEQDRQVLALGGDYKLTPKVRAYGRYEFISTLFGGPYDLEKGAQNSVGMFGLESQYMKGGKMFSEYRLRDTIDGRSAQSAHGLRNTFSLKDGLRLTGGAEYTGAARTVDGTPGGEAIAATTGFEYTGSGRYAGRMRANGAVELRRADDSKSVLNTLGLAYKLDRDWSLLGRSTYSESCGRDGSGDRLLTRQQIGIAYRPVDDDYWNALGRYEHKFERATGSELTATRTHILSAHLNLQPSAELSVNSRYAAKWTAATYDGLKSAYWAQLLHARATRDIARRWDVGLQAGVLVGQGGAQQRTAGVETGFQVAPNLWFSLGYNMLGIKDPDLAGADHLDHGPYLRLRFKFDESLFKSQGRP